MKQRDTDAEGRHWAGLVGSGRKLGKGGREWRVRDREGGAHWRAEGRRRRPQEQLLELPLQVLQALPLALLLRGACLAHGVENISEDLPGALRER